VVETCKTSCSCLQPKSAGHVGQYCTPQAVLCGCAECAVGLQEHHRVAASPPALPTPPQQLPPPVGCSMSCLGRCPHPAAAPRPPVGHTHLQQPLAPVASGCHLCRSCLLLLVQPGAPSQQSPALAAQRASLLLQLHLWTRTQNRTSAWSGRNAAGANGAQRTS
jgi:hypothetical protein